MTDLKLLIKKTKKVEQYVLRCAILRGRCNRKAPLEYEYEFTCDICGCEKKNNFQKKIKEKN